MCKALIFFIWLLGALLAVVLAASAARKTGSLSLEDVLIAAVTAMFSFFGIVFLALFHVCEIVADKFGNPDVWVRNKDDK